MFFSNTQNKYMKLKMLQLQYLLHEITLKHNTFHVNQDFLKQWFIAAVSESNATHIRKLI